MAVSERGHDIGDLRRLGGADLAGDLVIRQAPQPPIVQEKGTGTCCLRADSSTVS